MAFFWVEFSDRPAGTIEASTGPEAKEIGGKFGAVTHSTRLPYPARPVLHQVVSTCPPFCFTPNECKGHTCCLKNYACSE